MPVATWNPTQFVARYPEFTAAQAANPALFSSYFDEAGLYLNNTDCSPVCNLIRRTMLLNMLVAHIAFLGGLLNADGQPNPVGRVSQASEGTVSASLDWAPLMPGSGPWFNQTQYGAAFWQATTNLRGFRYSPRPTYFGQRRGPYGIW